MSAANPIAAAEQLEYVEISLLENGIFFGKTDSQQYDFLMKTVS